MGTRRKRWIRMLGAVTLVSMIAQPVLAKSEENWGITVTPANKGSEVAPDAVITVTFADPVVQKNKKELTDSALSSIVQLTDDKRKRIPFTAKWNKSNRTITIDPVGNLESGRSYTFTLPEKKLADGRGRVNPEVKSTFSTKKAVDLIPPRAVILPGHGAKQVKLQEKVTLQFAELVVLTDGNTLSTKTAGPLVRVTDDKGVPATHTITWNKSNRTLSVKPKGKWQPYTTYHIHLAAGLLKDEAGNANQAQWSSFTTGAK